MIESANDEPTEIVKNEYENTEETEEKLQDYYLLEFIEAFALLDEESTNVLSKDKLFQLMRVLGVPSTIRDHLEVLVRYDPDKTGFFDYKSCLDIMTEKWQTVDPTEEMREAFLQFDTTGYLHEKEMRKIMTTFGNPLNKTELNKFMKEADINAKGLILWEDYIHLMNPNKISY